MEKYAGAGLGMDSWHRKKFVAQFTNEELDVYYKNYKSYLEDQRLLYSQTDSAELLYRLKPFPRLCKIECVLP